MNINLYKKSIVLTTLLFVSVFVSNVSAQWQKIRFQDAAYAGYLTKSGNLLLSDYLYDGTGGIYLSEDGGTTWTQTDAEDHCYNKFYAYGDYIFAIGTGADMARSADEGKTWQMVSYKDAALEVMDPDVLSSTVAYAITEYDGKLFVGDFNGGGVMYSEDYGETWKRTDVESMKYTVQDAGYTMTYVENIYQLVNYKNKLYAFGVFYVFEYNDVENNWTMVRDDSNFMAVSTIFDGNLYCGRSCPNDDPEAPFLEMTSDFVTWTKIKGPEEILSKNVRVMASDDNYIYVATQDRGAFVLDTKTDLWYNICDGYPEIYPDIPELRGLYHAPTQMFFDDDYIYLVLYDFSGAPGDAAGLYKYPKDEIMQRTSINNVKADTDFIVDDGYITFPGEEAYDVKVFDISGKQVCSSTRCSRLYIGQLEKGMYVFEALTGGKKVVGKFVF